MAAAFKVTTEKGLIGIHGFTEHQACIVLENALAGVAPSSREKSERIELLIAIRKGWNKIAAPRIESPDVLAVLNKL
jgi:hypothetical protein